MEDFDASVDAGWQRMAAALGDRLATMEPGDSHAIDLGFLCEDGMARENLPIIVFTTHGTTRVRCTVGNATPTEDTLLAEAGWRERGTHPRTMETGRRRADHLARCAVAVLRDVFDVPDASFVDGTTAARVEPEVSLAGVPSDPDELQAMVDAAIVEISGRPVEHDEDGDIPLPTAVPSWLRVSTEEAAIELFSTRIDDSRGVTPEMLYAAVDGWPGVAVTVRSGVLVSRMRIEATVFVRENLRAELKRWFAFLDHGVDELRAAIACRSHSHAGSDECDRTEELPPTDGMGRGGIIRTTDVTTTAGRVVSLPAALETLLLVATTQSGDLRPDDVAAIMERDRDVTLRCHRVCISQRDDWETEADAAADRDDVEEAHACLVESWRWAEVAQSLRSALRLIVLERPRPQARSTERRTRDHRPPRLSDPGDRR
ncbi:TY-Chap domain-containing protein [Williamsia deligens]|uniref:Uncharacterized protein n=1 Tax=Williamsia deligens TaxID=321325 RepID=A0ABW3G872_9NOCA|nr:hypothetical protein [Williamsia deligens]MCP2192758.1 hypothetical protein [Williamsia deligens]